MTSYLDSSFYLRLLRLILFHFSSDLCYDVICSIIISFINLIQFLLHPNQTTFSYTQLRYHKFKNNILIF